MPSIFSAFDRNKTFKPVKNVQTSHHQELHKKLEATLNKDSYTDMLIQESVKLPPTEIVNEWISFHMIEFYNKINAIFGQMQECCTDESCPKMMSSAGFLYLWRDSTSKKYKKATEVSAPEYIALSIDKIETLLNDTTIFSTTGDFPKEFRRTVKDMSKKIFRVYAHVFHHHYSEVTDRKMETNFLFAFKHFLFFAMEFRLINEKELEPMIPWIEKSTGIDVEKYLKSKKKEKHNQKKSGIDSNPSTSSSNSSTSGANSSSSGDLSSNSSASTSDDKQPKKRNGHKRNDSLRAEDFNLIRRRSASVMAPNDNINSSQQQNSLISSSANSGNSAVNIGTSGLNTSSDSNGSSGDGDSHKAIYAIEPNKISTLLVEVIEACNLDAKNTNDTSDGFAVLKFEGQEVKTEVIWKELNPKWNERFTFIVKNISSNLHIAVYDENRLSKAVLIGVLDFNCQELADEVKHDLWLDLKNKDSGTFAGRIHIKCIFTSSESGAMGYLKKITNLNFYNPLLQFLMNTSPSVFIALFDNNKLNVDDKIYKSLIYLTTYGCCISTNCSNEKNQKDQVEAFNVSVMKYIIRLEVEKTVRISQLLRSNTISTKLVGMYLKIFGQGYLKKTLQDLTQRICEEDRFLECSPDAIRKEDHSVDPHSKATENLTEIINYARQYMQLIKNSVVDMPQDIRQITSHLREQVMKKYEGAIVESGSGSGTTTEGTTAHQQLDGASMGTIAATSLLFLRFITPCITAPHLFQLVQTSPQKNAQRTLMLVSKILQQLANETEFSEKKEAFMVPANEFLREQKSILRGFLDDVCDVSKDDFTLRKSTDGSESEENSDRLLWSLYNAHVLFYDNDSTLFPLLQECKKKGTTAHLSYFELNNESAEELADKYDQLRNVVAHLGAPPQLSLATRQKIATAFSKRGDTTEIPTINLN